MKTISAPLKAGIDDGTVCACIKVTRKDSTVLGFTDHDVELTVDSVLYKPTPGLFRLVMNLRNDASVSNQEFAAAWSVDLDEQDLSNGLYDDALVEVIDVDWTTPSNGGVPVFAGNTGLIQWSEDGWRADTHSTMKRLSRPIGVQVTAKCRYNLFDQIGPTSVGMCGLSAGSFTYASDVTVINTQKLKFDITSIGQGDDWVANGVLTWTSGNNNGASYSVKEFTSNEIILFVPTIFTIQVGDTFDVTAGCDKTHDTCKSAKFSNGDNFGGFPHVRNEANFK